MKTIFVSSTFKDMHFERDAIQEQVLPEVNREAAKYGQRVSFCDLRWGVNTKDLDSDEGSRRVLDVCLDEIDRCKPPMVVILGDRYGWIPDENLILTAAERKQLQLEDYQTSVTALEIEYGALSDEEKRGRTLFYFREIENDAPKDYAPEDEAHAAKLRGLKDKIIKLTNGRIKTYKVTWNGAGFDGIGTFAKMLSEDLKELLVPEWKAYDALTPFERDMRIHTSFVKEKAAMFRARQAAADKLFTEIKSGKTLTVIKGESGSGKSTLLCKLAEMLMADGENVFPIISGLTAQSNNAMDIVRTIAFYFEEQMGLPHYDEETEPQTGERIKHTSEEWTDKLAELSYDFARSGKKVIFMLDAVDQLFANEDRDRLIFIPRNLSEHVKFVYSSLSEFHTETGNDTTILPLDEQGCREVIEGTLAANGKQLSEKVIKAMVRLDGADNPLFLSLLIQRLTMMNRLDFEIINSGNKDDQMSEIENRQLAILEDCPETLNAMYAELLNEAGRRINPGLVHKAAEYLALSRHGLRPEDLSALLGGSWDALDFAHFIGYMSDSFIKRDDGRYDFSHKSIRAGFTEMCGEEKQIHTELLEHFKSLPETDEVRILEIVYHAIKADDKPFFVEYVAKYVYNANQDFISNAAKITYEHCLEDKGKWLYELLEHGEELKAEYLFIAFINFNLREKFDKTSIEMHSLLPILEAAFRLAERVNAANTSADNLRNTAICYTHTADIYQHFGGRDNLDRALELFRKSMKTWEQLAETVQNTDSRRGLSGSYERVAGIYQILGGRDNLDRAFELFRKSMDIREQLVETVQNTQSLRDLSVSYEWVAGIYQILGGRDNLVGALALYQKSMDISEQLAKKVQNTQSLQDLSVSYDRVAGIYQILGDKEKLDMALELFRKSMDIREQLAEKVQNTDSMRGLSVSYDNVAGIYQILGGRDNLDKALELFQKALKIGKQLTEKVQSTQSLQDLSVSYENVADIYQILGGRDNLDKALELFRKAMEIREQLAEKVQNTDSMRGLSVSYDRVAGIYRILGGRDNLDRALAFFRKAMDIRGQLAEKIQNTDSMRGLSVSYSNVADIYKKFGGRDNLDKALALYLKSLKIDKQLNETVRSSNSMRDLSVSYNNAADIYQILGGRYNLDKALALFRKAMDIREQLAETVQSTQSLQDLLISYNKVAGIYEEFGGSNNLENSLELELKALAIAVQLAKESGTVDTYELLARTYGMIAMHPLTAKKDKKTFLEQGLQIATMLYDTTGMEQHKELVDAFTDILNDL